MKISLVPIASLVPYARNARTHSDAQIAQIAASIAEFGFTIPIVADKQGIVAGHGRVMAARQLIEAGQTIRSIDGKDLPEGKLPVLDCTGWSDAQRRAYVLADNRLALNAGWDAELLEIEIRDLDAADFDLSLLGFEQAELDELLGLAGEEDMPGLADGDREPFQEMTFILHDTQAQVIEQALKAAKALGPFLDSPNENSNGNALARACSRFLAAAAPAEELETQSGARA